MTADDPRIPGVVATIEWLRPWVDSFGQQAFGFEAYNLLRELETWLEQIREGTENE